MKTWGELRYSSAHSYPQPELTAVAALFPGKEPLIGDSRGSTAGLLLVNTVTILLGLNHSISFVKS